MASRAGPPSGSGIDIAYLLARLDEQVRQVEQAWDGSARVSPEGGRHISDFAAAMLSDLDRRGLPPGVDEGDVVRQLDALVPDFLGSIRYEAEQRDAMIRGSGGAAEIPAALIDQRIAAFTAQRCLCWPQ